MNQHNQRPKISIVMVDGSFRERYESIDFMAGQDMPTEDFELIWVEYYDTIALDLQRRIDARPGFRAVALGRTGTYHSSYCFNHGIAEARGELVVIPDADVIAEPDFLQNVWRDHQASDRLVTYYHRHNEPKDKHTDTIELDHLRAVCELTNPSNHGACLSVRRHWLDEINGYEQSWRGRTLSTLPFQGMDPARNTTPPQRFQECERWLASLDQPKWKRAVNKIAAKIGYTAHPQRKAA